MSDLDRQASGIQSSEEPEESRERKTNTGRVLLAIPCGDGRIETLTMISVIQACAAAGPCTAMGETGIVWGNSLRGPFILANNSNVHDARNKIAQYFKAHCTDCDRLVMIDSDIAFTLEDFGYLLEGDEDIVIAPYAKKSIGEPHVEFGCGFARVHRRVFEKLDAWVTEEGEALPRFQMQMITGQPSETATDYFFDGASPDGRWFGEDVGFWHWCAMNQCSMRQEKRTKLIHIGKAYYCYPDQFPGMVSKWSGAQ